MSDNGNGYRSPAERLGQFDVEKGLIREGKTLFAWDGIKECHPECPVRMSCNYLKKGPCQAHRKYLSALLKSITNTYKYMDDTMLYRVGMHLIPLYSQLFQFKLKAMEVNSVTYTNDKGNVLIHPVFKEIRECLKCIHIMWRGLDLKPISDGDLVPPGDEDIEPDGDSNYYQEKVNKPALRKTVIR